MKRSGIFLALTAAILALAGVIAAKSSKSGSSTFYYYTIVSGIRCVKAIVASTILFCVTATVAWSYYTVGGGNSVVPTYYSVKCTKGLTYCVY